METLITQYLITIGWALTGALSMALSLGILLKIFTWITPINEWEELRKGNYAVAIVLGAVVLGSALVISFTVMP